MALEIHSLSLFAKSCHWLKKHLYCSLKLSLAGFWLASPALALSPEAGSCRNGLFAVHKGHVFQLGRIQGTSPVSVYKDEAGCPGGKGCQTPHSLIPGDQVILNQIVGDWACVWFAGKNPAKADETVGWVPRPQIALNAPPPAPRLQDWAGHWRFAGVSDLTLSPSPDKQSLTLDGQAFWYGARVHGDRVIHTGEIQGAKVRPERNRLRFQDGKESWACHLEMTLLPPFLIVDDNLGCGGMNVTFRGIYTRQAATGKHG